MTARGIAWRRMAPIWVPAVLFFLGNLAVLGWLSGSTVGREAQVRAEVDRLEGEVRRLERLQRQARQEREAVEALHRDMTVLYDDVLGSLEERLTPILREVGEAARGAGLRPEKFSYTAKEVKKLNLFEFSVKFSVEARYTAVVKLLEHLRNSPQFLIVDRLSLAGEEGSTTDTVRLGIRVKTYVAEADEALLEALRAGSLAGGEGP